MNRKELIAAVAGKAGVAEADTDKVLAGTAAIFVGRTTTTGAINPSSHRCPCSVAAGTLRADPSFAEGQSCPRLRRRAQDPASCRPG